MQITLGSWTGYVPSSLSDVAARASGVMLMEIREGVAESEVYLVVRGYWSVHGSFFIDSSSYA